MIKLSKTISFILGPSFVLFPIPFILVVKFTHDYSYALKWAIFSYVFMLAVAIFVILGVLFGFFSNFDVSKREQRPLLFSFCGIAMFFYLISLFIFNGPKVLFIGFFAVLLGLIAIVIINKWIKASIHLAVATSVALFIGIVYGGYYFLFLSLIPLLAFARVKAKEHTLIEAIIGIILGIVLTLIVYVISKQFLFGLIYN